MRSSFRGPLHRLVDALARHFALSHPVRHHLCRCAQSIEHGGGTMVGVQFLAHGAIRSMSPTFWMIGVILIALIYLLTDADLEV